MIDVLTYMLPPQTFWLENHLESSVSWVNPVYTLVQPGMFWYIKGKSGFPWDGNVIGEDYIYQLYTENSWTDPQAYKAFASKSWPNGSGGIAWCPRWITPNAWSAPVVTADSTYNTYAACKITKTSTLGGPIVTQVSGPYSMDFGGDLGTQSAIIQTYQWGAGLVNMEVNYYAENFGHTRWQLWTLVNGAYVLKTDNQFNLVKSGGTMALNFPCGN